MSSKNTRIRGVAGLDEAGRGPMIGPMIICGVLFEKGDIKRLESLGLRDSKVLSPKRRRNLDKSIRRLAARIEIKTITAAEIDALRKSGYTMNEIETINFAFIVKELKPEEVYMDAADVNAERFGRLVAEKSGLASLGTRFISEHKADARYPVVSAAAIIAKVERDARVADLYDRYGDFGSGYPSDPKSIAFIRQLLSEEGELPSFVRKSWASIKRIQDEMRSGQMGLDNF